MDNFSTHRHTRVEEYLAHHYMEAVPTPTYASWLNAIEAHFTPLKKFVLTVSDDRDHRHRRAFPSRRRTAGPEAARSTAAFRRAIADATGGGHVGEAT